jgi:microcystin-dependent protein
MSDAYLGDIKLVAFSFAPRGWAQCNGQLLPIAQNQALFSLLGTTYGGDGQRTFALPDLRGRIALHPGPQYSAGAQGGEVNHTLTTAEIPVHPHTAQGNTAAATMSSPTGQVLAGSAASAYGSTPDTPMNALAVSTTGSSQPHPNMPPFLVLNYIICLAGLYPSRN